MADAAPGSRHAAWLASGAHPGRLVPGHDAATPHEGGWQVPLRPCPGDHRPDIQIIEESPHLARLNEVKQAFLFPIAGQRTRRDHCVEVAQIAKAIAEALGLDADLAWAGGLGHDCGHAPGGHAGEDALSFYLDGGFDHATWGADVTLAGSGLSAECLDTIRNHSWSHDSPRTAEGQLVGLADRIAYVTHDPEDAITLGLAWRTPAEAAPLGATPAQWRAALIADAIDTSARARAVSLSLGASEAVKALRAECNRIIYQRPASVAENAAMVEVVRWLMEHPAYRDDPGGPERLRHVAGLTDREACDEALDLDFRAERLPLTTAQSAGTVGHHAAAGARLDAPNPPSSGVTPTKRLPPLGRESGRLGLGGRQRSRR